jgi:site-specific DNA recombinase
MPSAVVYTRVSTEEQAKTGLSLENQEKACREFAERNGYQVLEVFREEGVSAKTADRKELMKMLNYCRSNKGGVDAVIVWKVDRFARRAEDHLALKAVLIKQNVQLLSVTEPIEDTNTGRLMETVLAAFAQFDNELRAERSKGGTYARVEQGGYPFYAPLGYANVKDSLKRPTLNKDSIRAPLIAQIFNEHKSGNYTQKQIAQFAFQIGLRSRKGQKLATQTVVNILQNPVYMSKVKSPSTGELIPAIHEPIITEEIYYDVQDIFKGKGKEFREEKDKNWPLRSGFLICATCKSPITGSSPKGRYKNYPRYSCPTCRKSITGKPVSVGRVEIHSEFIRLLENIRPEKHVLVLFRKVTLARWNEDYKELNKRNSQLANDFEALNHRRQRVMDLYVDGKLSDEDKDDQLTKIDSERSVIRIRRSELDEDVDNRELVIDVAVDFMNNVSKYWSTAPLKLQKRFQNLVFPDGIEYVFGEGFGTANLGAAYEMVAALSAKTTKSGTRGRI